MLNTVFYCVVNMSITAAIIGTAVLLVRGILGRRLPKLAVYILWSLVLFRMLIPFSFGAPWSFIKSLSSITGYSVKVVIVQTPVRDLAGLSAMNHIQEASDYYPVEYKSTSISENFKLAAWIWFCGVLACGLLTTALYSFTIHRLKRAVLLKDEEGILKSCKSRLKVKACSQIYTCKMVDSPLVLGIIRPRIIIPEGIDKGSLQYILLHELVHIKRKDNLWRLMATA
ncbi:MAG: M56 family metallopeptidase, partial [Bacillota bacterium]|nr:M56 family metallopeptidase [Bacillota bacterium]